MLSITLLRKTGKGLAKIGDYYTEAKQLEEYYEERKIFTVNFMSDKKCEEMDFTDRLNLLGGRKRLGLDFTFSAPKSFSIAHQFFDKKEVETCFLLSVKRLCQEVNEDVVARVEGERVKGNGFFSIFLHELSREKEPHTHAHIVLHHRVETEKGLYTLENSLLFKKKTYYDIVAHYELAYQLQERGYRIHFSKENVELTAIDEAITELFKTRRKQIEEFAKTKGLSIEQLSHSARTAIAYLTRKEKERVEHDELFEFWMEQVCEAGINLDEVKLKLKGKFSRELSNEDVVKAVKDSLKKLHQTQSLVQDWILEKQVIKEIMQKVNEENVRLIALDDLRVRVRKTLELMEKKGLLKRFNEAGETFYSLSSVVSEEARMIEVAKRLQKEKFYPFDLKVFDGSIKEFESSKGFQLTREQVECAIAILNPNERICTVEGHAGTGKTTLYELIRTYAEKKGIRTIGLAPTGKAAEELKASLGAGITVDSLLVAYERNPEKVEKIMSNTLVIVDEAGMLSASKAKRLLEIVERTGAKVVLSGDRKQFQSIERGSILRDLLRAGIMKASLYQIRRQKDINYLEITRALSSKDFETAFKKIYLQKDNWKEFKVEDTEKILYEIARDFKRKKDLVVVQTNELKDRLNQKIREKLQIKDDIKAKVLVTRNVNPERISDATAYKVGDRLLFVTGQEYTVESIDERRNVLLVRTQRGKSKEIKASEITLDNLKEVFNEAEKVFGRGELIMALKNNSRTGLKNGQVLQVVDMQGDIFLLKDVKSEKVYKVDLKEYRYFDYAYAVTCYKSQGVTVDRVIYLQPEPGKTNFHEFYVSLTRGRTGWKIYTTNMAKLFANAEKTAEKATTISWPEKENVHGEHFWRKKIREWESKDYAISYTEPKQMEEREVFRKVPQGLIAAQKEKERDRDLSELEDIRKKLEYEVELLR